MAINKNTLKKFFIIFLEFSGFLKKVIGLIYIVMVCVQIYVIKQDLY
ncbi:uncharacterized protein METZ01_LOCUS63368 [marine metagenome]|uniref:Uncharacterized protein n=1 Tax=marine metagenome TaxID=408172 RepID=A0A381T469_9ZZZZ